MLPFTKSHTLRCNCSGRSCSGWVSSTRVRCMHQNRERYDFLNEDEKIVPNDQESVNNVMIWENEDKVLEINQPSEMELGVNIDKNVDTHCDISIPFSMEEIEKTSQCAYLEDNNNEEIIDAKYGIITFHFSIIAAFK